MSNIYLLEDLKNSLHNDELIVRSHLSGAGRNKNWRDCMCSGRLSRTRQLGATEGKTSENLPQGWRQVFRYAFTVSVCLKMFSKFCF